MNKKRIDWVVTLVPMGLVCACCILFFFMPERSNEVIMALRNFVGSEFGVYYLAVSLGIFLLSLYTAFSRFGTITLGEPGEKPKYSFFQWGAMMFTAGLAADILFYSFSEWMFYADDPHIAELGSMEDWASTYTLFHWGPIPWGFYLILAVAFGFMLHVRKRTRQKYSESLRPLLGNKVDGAAGRFVDILAVFALIAGTATTFSIATPLMAEIVRSLFGIEASSRVITIVILLITCAIYTFAVLKGMTGVSWLAKVCIYLFYGLLLYVLIFGGEARYILEMGFSALGRLTQNFFTMSTYTDPHRETGFAQNWTVFYWAYWMVWCVASPFFIGSISRGRTIRDTILGGYIFGVGSTIVSFIILGNYGLGLQTMGKLDLLSLYHASGDLYTTIISIVNTLPLAPVVLVVLLLAMTTLYATSFDSIAIVASDYSYRTIGTDEEPSRLLRAFWSITLILLPVALVFSDSSMSALQSVSILAALPISVVIILIVISFFKDADHYLQKELPEILSRKK